MSKKMLIDASHPEETRVVIVDGTRVEELDFESRNKRQLRGNVYLARVTRVEPSLQAAFVEYGGNRHGFLAFSEIHPDYYQIPYEDRMALIEDEVAENSALDEDEDEETDIEDVTETDEDADETEDRDENLDPDEEDVSDEADEEVAREQVKVASTRRKHMSRRRYKIQEVIKRGQILLIQAVKEERGNKGAAMTTYLSLAGRYCVLMPNTPRGGGISRKIANGSDRKRLKGIMSELEVPQGMGVIVRTAGAKRTKIEIKRDYDYLSRLWETIRETTLKSIAPALIHEEGNLVKRSIRDMYNKDIDEVLVQGDDAYKTAKDFIKMLMPSHAKNVKAYKDKIPLFLRYQVEKQIEASLDSVVQLASGGYLVIHPTEALVSVDVNSGRSTKERNVERTALKTNLEAAEEVGRQMRLRDLAGLVVIDFIDMDENKNNRAVEKRMKDVLSKDRARVQFSRISQFGLMEISRQRRRRSLLEGSTTTCNHCGGVGRKRTVESSALVAIRAVEEIGARRQMKRIRLKVSPDVAIYIFNEKRDLLQHVDNEFDMFTELVGDDTLIRPGFVIESLENRKEEADPLKAIEEEQRKEARSKRSRRRKRKDDDDTEEDTETSDTDTQDTGEDEEPRKRRRRRGRRGGRGKRGADNAADTASEQDTCETDTEAKSEETEAEPKRKRGRRKAPSRNVETAHAEADADIDTPTDTVEADDKPRSTARRKAPSRKKDDNAGQAKEEAKPKRKRKASSKKKTEDMADVKDATADESAPPKPRSSARRKAPAKTVKDSSATLKPRKRRSKKTDAAAVETTVAKLEAKVPARRKAPGRKAKPDVETENVTKKPATKRKASTKKAAPKKAAPKKAAPKKAAPKKAPAKKAAPKKTSEKKAPTKTAASKKAAPKKVSSKKAAPKKSASKKVTESTTEATKTTPARRKAPPQKHAPDMPDAEAKEMPKKKRSWLKRLTKSD